MQYEKAFPYSHQALLKIYDKGEAKAITRLLVNFFKGKPWNADAVEDFKIKLGRLLKHEPIQYVLQEAWFYGYKFYVNENVLIPRPETEELVQWVLQENEDANARVLDIGTGSGCIAITLKQKGKYQKVAGWDVEDEILKIASENALTIGVEVVFENKNVLEEVVLPKENKLDIIISNPPYIPASQAKTMDENVVEFEPHKALFVDDENPLMFYEAIARFAKQNLAPDGKVYVELDAKNASNTQKLFDAFGFKTILRKDIFDNYRMLKAC